MQSKVFEKSIENFLKTRLLSSSLVLVQLWACSVPIQRKILQITQLFVYFCRRYSKYLQFKMSLLSILALSRNCFLVQRTNKASVKGLAKVPTVTFISFANVSICFYLLKKKIQVVGKYLF